MQVLKVGGKVYGAKLTAAETKAMNIEIKRQLAEFTRNHEAEVDAIVLYVLREEFGFGEKRLRRFYNGFRKHLSNLINRYEVDNDDLAWLCTTKLKDAGIDITEWRKEVDNQM